MCSLYLIPAYALCVASAAKEEKTLAGLLCNVELRREAATRLLEAASACSTAGGETCTFGASVNCPGANYMDAWPALCTALGHVLAYPYRVLLRTNSRLCPSSRKNLGGHTAIAFHPSSDWMRRLATSVFTGESNSRMPPVVVVVVVAVFLVLFCSSSETGAVDVSRVSDQLTYPGRRS